MATSTPAIDPVAIDCEIYGSTTRAEALADWLELAAIAGRRVTSAQLAGMIFDNGWAHLAPTQYSKHGGPYTEPGDEDQLGMAAALTDAVRSVLTMRETVLGERWPFKLEPSWQVKLREGVDLYCPYTAMLAITVAHAWGVETGCRPELVLEDSARRALISLGLGAVGFGTGSNAVGTFEERVAEAADVIGLESDAGGVTRARSARDEGADTFAIILGLDTARRAGQWVFVGQVTTAKSSEWKRKFAEPVMAHWKDRLLQPLTPQRFLVVPHHANSEQLYHLVNDDTGVVIDRIRLALALEDVSTEERQIIDAVVEVGVEDGRAAA